MSARRRMALAFYSMLLAEAMLYGFPLVKTTVVYGPRFFGDGLSMVLFYMIFALPGWLISLPFVLLFKDAKGWHAWATLLIGTAIGPGFLLILGGIENHGRLIWEPKSFGTRMALLVAFFTSLFYVVMLRSLDSRRRMPEQEPGAEALVDGSRDSAA